MYTDKEKDGKMDNKIDNVWPVEHRMKGRYLGLRYWNVATEGWSPWSASSDLLQSRQFGQSSFSQKGLQ